MLDVLERTTNRLLNALRAAPPDVLAGESALSGWTRLTIVAHLRYVARASLRMTNAALQGRPEAMYPDGRAMRPATLEPGPGESVGAVVGSLGEASAALHERWRGLSEVQWETVLSEPELGEVSLTTLCFMRLTEVEVHSVDLDLGLGPWSDEFVEAAFAVRVLALPRLRRRPDADRRVCGSWLLSDGVESWYVEAEGATATVERSAPLDEVISIIEGDRRALVGMLLGRVPVDTLELTGNIDLAKAFKAAFPGP